MMDWDSKGSVTPAAGARQCWQIHKQGAGHWMHYINCSG